MLFRSRTDLDGCTDIDLANSPFTNSIVIHRLPLHVGHTAEVPVVTVDVETLALGRAMHRYTRTGESLWTYTSLASGSDTTATVDANGIVMDEDRLGDSLIEYQGRVVLLVDPELGKQLMNATFDFAMSPQGPRFKLDVRPILG